MNDKSNFGRVCEDFVAELIREKTGYDVLNLNDIKVNYPVTDLRVKDSRLEVEYEISIKAKKSPTWPAVKGIRNENQFIIFVDIYKTESPVFYILNNSNWNNVLETIMPNRDADAEIVDGALEWNWVDDGQRKKFRGSKLLASDIEQYKNNWTSLPGVG
jgi:hypothetical protein